MKIKIGDYKNWFGPYQLADFLCFWAKEKISDHDFKEKPLWVRKFGEWLAFGYVKTEQEKRKRHALLDHESRPKTFLYKFLLFLNKLKKRTVKVKIDPWDTINISHTLGYIILPLLKHLRDKGYTTPEIDDEDLPEEIRILDIHARWDWILDEIIWAFDQHMNDDNEAQFFSGVFDKISVPVDKNFNEIPETDMITKIHAWAWKDGDHHTLQFDEQSYNLWLNRKLNGFRLFGKYYTHL